MRAGPSTARRARWLSEREALELARASGDDGVWPSPTWANAFVGETMGELVITLDHLDRALALIDPVRHAMLRYHYGGVDPGVASFAAVVAGFSPCGALSDQGMEET